MTYRGPAGYDPEHEAADAEAVERERLTAAALAEVRDIPGRWEVFEVAPATRHSPARVWLVWHYAEDLDGFRVLWRDGHWRAVEPAARTEWPNPREALAHAAAIIFTEWPDDARAAMAVLETR